MAQNMTLDETILRLISQHKIGDQVAFLDLLERHGLRLTQPTLSRHLHKLGIRKAAGHYQQMEPLPVEIPPFTLTTVPPALLVLHTRPGYAQPLAVRLDHKKIAGVAGTIAGDDTVFIAVTAPPSLETVGATVNALLARDGLD